MVNAAKLNNFDLLRIIAATQVLVGHTLWHLGIPTAPWVLKLVYAFPGVPIFFVISGFLISMSYEKSPNLRHYARNRALRIFPGLWCCLVVTVVVYGILGVKFPVLQTLVWFVSQLAGIIYTPHFMKNFGFGSYNGSLWSIPVELQFYCLVPLLYWLCKKFANPTACIAAVFAVFSCIALLYREYFPPLDDAQQTQSLQKLFGYTFVPHFYLFTAGALFQRIKAHGSPWVAGKGLMWIAAYLAILYLAPNSPGIYILGNLVLAIATISVAYSAPGASKQLLKGNDISYGVYIYHAVVVNTFITLGLTVHVPYLFVTAASVYVIAYLSWILVERRFMRKKDPVIAPDSVLAV